MFTFYLKTTGVEATKDDVPAVDHQPDESESLGVVLLGCREASDLPGLVLAIYYDAPGKKLTAVVFPPETVCMQNGKEDTIAGHYDYEGVRGGLHAVGALLETDIQRYIRIQRTGISNLTDFLGGVEWTLEEDTLADGEEMLAGQQLLDGRRFAAFLFDTSSSKTTDGDLQAAFLEKLLKNGLTEEMAPRLEKLTNALLYNSETNLNQYDFMRRREGMRTLLEKGELQIEVFCIAGSYNTEKTEFYPSPEGIEKVKSIFFTGAAPLSEG